MNEPVERTEAFLLQPKSSRRSRLVAAAASLVLLGSVLSGQAQGLFNNLTLTRNSESCYLSLSPVVLAGTHVNGIGAKSEAGWRFFTPINNSLIGGEIGGFAYPMAYATYYGIPGTSVQLQAGGALSVCFGPKSPALANPWTVVPLCMHTITYYLSYYLSSDGTSQPYGGIGYQLNLGSLLFFLRLDDDDAFLLPEDKFRTTKGLAGFRYHDATSLYGIDLGFILWTGDLNTNAFSTLILSGADVRNLSYSLGYGGAYSHGIITLCFVYDFLQISIGYDSDKIRDYIQNGWHYLYNRPHVPLLSRSDRLYLQFSLFNAEHAY